MVKKVSTMMDAKVKYVYIKMLNKSNTVIYWFDFWLNIATENNKNVYDICDEADNFLDYLKIERMKDEKL